VAVHVVRKGIAICDRQFYKAHCEYCNTEFLCEENDMQKHTSKSDANNHFFSIQCITSKCYNLLNPVQTDEKPEVISAGRE
jgi:hypothetical protein